MFVSIGELFIDDTNKGQGTLLPRVSVLVLFCYIKNIYKHIQ